jgi:hypothetical protein
MIKKIALARRAQRVGSGLHPESHFENTAKLFICAADKNSRRRVHTYREASQTSLRSLRRPGTSCLRTTSTKGLYEGSYRLNTGARTPQSTSVHRLAVVESAIDRNRLYARGCRWLKQIQSFIADFNIRSSTRHERPVCPYQRINFSNCGA